MSSPSDRVHGTPPTNTSAPTKTELAARLARQQREREEAIKRLAELRKKASDEIDRLLTFLDASDPYVQNELEEEVDGGPCDDNELEPSLCGVTVGGGGGGEDLELDASDDEPSLGSLEHTDQTHWGASARRDLEEEHDSL